jgi:hypothetical protein
MRSNAIRGQDALVVKGMEGRDGDRDGRKDSIEEIMIVLAEAVRKLDYCNERTIGRRNEKQKGRRTSKKPAKFKSQYEEKSKTPPRCDSYTADRGKIHQLQERSAGANYHHHHLHGYYPTASHFQSGAGRPGGEADASDSRTR